MSIEIVHIAGVTREYCRMYSMTHVDPDEIRNKKPFHMVDGWTFVTQEKSITLCGQLFLPKLISRGLKRETRFKTYDNNDQ